MFSAGVIRHLWALARLAALRLQALGLDTQAGGVLGYLGQMRLHQNLQRIPPVSVSATCKESKKGKVQQWQVQGGKPNGHVERG